MTTTAPGYGAAIAVQRFALAGSFFEGLAAQDFSQPGDAVTADAHLRALLPSGRRQWTGAGAVADRFAGWFAGTEDLELGPRAP